jgi:hypothetical protein
MFHMRGKETIQRIGLMARQAGQAIGIGVGGHLPKEAQ